MIKTLLLATSCVIGSGAGALQNNAPAFYQPHYQITQETQGNTNYIYADSENITNQANTINLPIENYDNPNLNTIINFNYGKSFQTGFNNTISKIDYAECYQSWNGLDDNTQTIISHWDELYNTSTDSYEDSADYKPYFNYYQVLKYTPYSQTQATNINFTSNPEFEITYGQSYGTEEGETKPLPLDFPSYAKWYYTAYTTTTDITSLMQFNDIANFKYRPFQGITGLTRIAYETYTSDPITGWTVTDDQNVTISRSNYNNGANLLPTYNLDWELEYDLNGLNEITFLIVAIRCEFDYSLEYTEEEKSPWPYYMNKSYYSVDRITNTKMPTPTYDYEIVDIGGLMFDILTMPFAFVSQAFNITLFPGTAYSINISNLFLAVFAALTFIFIIKKFIKR